MNLIVFVGSGSGKITQSFLSSLLRYRCKFATIIHFETAEEFESQYHTDAFITSNKILILPIYCEDIDLKRKHNITLTHHIERICRDDARCIILHSGAVGSILGSKSITNNTLSKCGVNMPRVVTTSDRVFLSNEDNNSSAPIKVLHPGEKIDENRYNTEFIDTSFAYNGKLYYANVRVMCVGDRIVDIFLRFKYVGSDPSVHIHAESVNLELQSYYFVHYVVPIIDKFVKACSIIGTKFGLGFYGHDFIIHSKTSELYLTESSFKFDNYRSIERALSAVWREYIMHTHLIPNFTTEKPSHIFFAKAEQLLT